MHVKKDGEKTTITLSNFSEYKFILRGNGIDIRKETLPNTVNQKFDTEVGAFLILKKLDNEEE